MPSQPATTRLIRQADAVRQQIIDRLHQGKLVYERDMAVLTSQVEIMLRIDEPLTAGRFFTVMGAIELNRGHFIAAHDYFQASLEHYEQANDENRVISALSNLGEVYRLWGKIDQALQFYDRARRMAHTVEDWGLVSLVLNNIGLLLLEDEEPQRALDLLEQSLDFGNRVTPPREEVILETYRGIARAYLALGRTREAWDAANRSLHLSEKHNRSQDIGAVCRTMGMIAAQSGTNGNPGQYFERSRQIFQACGAQAEYARTLQAEARWLIASDKPAAAQHMLLEAERLFTKLHLPAEAGETHQVIESLSAAV